METCDHAEKREREMMGMLFSPVPSSNLLTERLAGVRLYEEEDGGLEIHLCRMEAREVAMECFVVIVLLNGQVNINIFIIKINMSISSILETFVSI